MLCEGLDSCTEGFPDFQTVMDLAEQCTSSSTCLIRSGNSDAMTVVIPSMRFTGSGTIVSWRVGGVYGSGAQNPNPRLQIWRPMTSDSSSYTIAHELSLLDSSGRPRSIERATVYEYVLSMSVTVLSGDILGIYFPRVRGDSRAFLDPYFEMSNRFAVDYFSRGGELTMFDQSGGTNSGLPLVAFEGTCDSKCSLSAMHP